MKLFYAFAGLVQGTGQISEIIFVAKNKMLKIYHMNPNAFFFIFWPVLGHGRILEPPGRSSYHLLTNDAEIDQSLVVPNYNDNQLFCGGLHTQIANEYKCGVCGGTD